MEREITSLYYYIFIRRLSNLLCHIQETVNLCSSSFWSYTDRHTHTKRQEDRPSLSCSILLFFQSTHLKDPSKALYFFVSICFSSPWQCLVLFPLHFTCASPWPQEQSSIYLLTCAPLSYSRVCTPSLPYLFPLQPFSGKKAVIKLLVFTGVSSPASFLCGQRRQQTAFLSGHWRCREPHPSPVCQIASVRLFLALGIKQKHISCRSGGTVDWLI